MSRAGGESIRIRMEAYDHSVLDQSAADICGHRETNRSRCAWASPVANAYRAVHGFAKSAYR